MEKIKSTETIIDSAYNHWWFGSDYKLMPEEGRKIEHRIHLLTQNYLGKILSAGWETLFQDPNDGRYWELSYPHGEYHGGGFPLLKHLSDEEAIAKYKISPRYIPELKPKPEDTIIDYAKLTEGMTMEEAHNVFFRLCWLLQYYLKTITVVSEEKKLYQDPGDYRYWELTYPNGYMLGSGSPLLRCVPCDEVKISYGI